jgi:hypothetical protein
MRFKVGDFVLLSTEDLNEGQLSRTAADKQIGPFRVRESVGNQAYRFILPPSYLIHPVFHVSKLEPFMPLPRLVDGNDEQYDVD